MDSFIKALPALLKASGAPEEVAEAACVAMWKHAVGAGLSSQAFPIQLRDQKLLVVVEDNLWKKQLEQMRGPLLFRLNSALGQGIVTSIEVRVDPETVAVSRAPAAESKKAATEYTIPAELLSVAAEIDDVDLRRAFLGAATSCIKRVESKGGAGARGRPGAGGQGQEFNTNLKSEI